MLNTHSTTQLTEDIGENIGSNLGLKFIKEFQVAFPNEIGSFVIGRKILEAILAQNKCEGIKIYNAIDENGEKTLVYVGVDSDRNDIIVNTSVDSIGSLIICEGIIGDRVLKPFPKSSDATLTADDWGWLID